MDTAGRIGLTHLPTINEAVLATDKALGHGKFDSMYDVVYIRPERYSEWSECTRTAGSHGVGRSLGACLGAQLQP